MDGSDPDDAIESIAPEELKERIDGVGMRLGKGCTSGHGVCGVGSLSNTSLVNVATFLVFAIGTAQLVQALGVAP